MSKTKQRILEKSLDLFNDKGIVAVSLRDISKELNISIGNLQYHYKKREDIVEGLYFDLVKKIDEEVLVLHKKLSVNGFFDVPIRIMMILFEYRFFLIDFVSISRNNETIKKHYAQLSIKREEQFLVWVNFLIERNSFRQPVLKNEYTSLYKAIEVISNFWFSNSLIQNDNLSEEVIKEYSALIRQLIYPYLTKQGQTQFSITYSALHL